MKFIRDIIAEKTKQIEANAHLDSAGLMANSAIQDVSESQLHADDPGHTAAFASRSPGRPGGIPKQDEAATKGPDGLQIDPEHDFHPRVPDACAEIDGEDDFDLLADAGDNVEPPQADLNGQEAANRPSELFDGVWAEDEAEAVAVDDGEFFDEAGDYCAREDIELGSFHAKSETNTEALMRTMNNTAPTTIESVAPPEKPVQQEVDNEASHSGNQTLSPYQKLLQRETTRPLVEVEEPTSEPIPEPIQEPAPELRQEPERVAAPAPAEPISVPAPAAGRARRPSGRVKTRLLGFGNEFGDDADVFASGGATDPTPRTKFPVGWMVIVSGPGRGHAFTLFSGVSQIGRGEDQAVRLDFGDSSISRSNHAAIAYDPEQQKFYLGHGGKANLVRLNNNPVLSTEALTDGAEIRLGETTLRFIGLCGAAFDWSKTQDDEGDNVRFG